MKIQFGIVGIYTRQLRSACGGTTAPALLKRVQSIAQKRGYVAVAFGARS